MDDIFAPYLKEYCNLIEALEYLAFGWEPVDDENLLDEPRRRFTQYFSINVDYNNIRKKENNTSPTYYIEKYRAYVDIETINYCRAMQKAIAKLKRLLNIPVTIPMGDAYIYMSVEKTTIKDNLGKFSFEEGVNDSCFLHFVDCNFSNAVIYQPLFKVSDLKPYTEKKEKHITSETTYALANNNYTTPYLTLINTMLQKGYVTEEEQPLADNLKEDIKKEAKKAGVEISDRLASSMATILRLPNMQRGGYRK